MELEIWPARESEAVQTLSEWILVGCLPPNNEVVSRAIGSEPLVLGRSPDAGLRIDSPRVSGKHAELVLIGEHLFIRDLASTNGTYVNRRRISQLTPIAAGDHIQVANVELRIEGCARPARVEANRTFAGTFSDLEALESSWVLSQLDQLIRTRAVTPLFQPIVSLKGEGIFGYEALARSHINGVDKPEAMFETARQFDREAELSCLCRERAAETAALLPHKASLFVNTYPSESFEKDVLPSLKKVRNTWAEVKLVVEVHENSVNPEWFTNSYRAELQEMGVQLAYGEFGAGSARLLELIKAPPSYLKFDSSMIRGLDEAGPNQLRMLKSLISMVRDFEIVPIAEGVETAAEAQACRDLEFELAQGFYFGRPGLPGDLLRSANA